MINRRNVAALIYKEQARLFYKQSVLLLSDQVNLFNIVAKRKRRKMLAYKRGNSDFARMLLYSRHFDCYEQSHNALTLGVLNCSLNLLMYFTLIFALYVSPLLNGLFSQVK